LGIGSVFENKFAISESQIGLKKSASKKIGGEKKFELKNNINETQPKKNSHFVG
jgi:hypothetical protein